MQNGSCQGLGKGEMVGKNCLMAHKERKKRILRYTFDHHIQPSGGRESLPADSQPLET